MSYFGSNRLGLLCEISICALIGFAVSWLVVRSTGAVALTLSGLVLAGLFLLQRLVTEYRVNRNRRAEREERQQADLAAGLYLNTIESLAIAIDAKDQTSHGHVRRTQTYATELGKLLDVSQTELDALKAGALLHDIGKLAVPEYILNKPGKLTKSEIAKIRIHPTVGADILSSVNFPYPVEDIVRYHHEKWDGSGYPKGLKAEAIPLVARIISVVDFYDATRCDRPYRAGMSREESLALLISGSGSAFDPKVVGLFTAHLEEFDRLITTHDLQEQIGTVLSLQNDVVDTDIGGLSNKSESPDRNAGFRSITEAQQEVYALHEIAQTIGSSLSLEDTVVLVSNKLRSIVPCDTCVIYLVDEEAGQAFPAHVSGNHADAFAGRRINIGDGITGWAIASGRTVSSSSPEVDLLRIPEELARDIKHMLVTPLKREDGAFGAISLYSQKSDAYTTEHIRLIETVSEYASNALNNALTFEKSKDSALIDQLTKLPNARSFYMTLEQRIAECQRLKNREPITVMSMNLDDFRRVNESFGHATGDMVLKSVSAILKNQLRQMDVLARYEGDEFIAILPMASHKTAYLIAERIHSAIKSHKFLAHSECEIELGISIGVASHPDDGDVPDALLTIARRNMQHDKRARKFAPTPIDSSFASIKSSRLQ